MNFESLSNLALLASILVTAIERSGISGSQKSFLTETVICFVNDGRKVWATVLFPRGVGGGLPYETDGDASRLA